VRGFRKFILRGNVVDLAVAAVIGTGAAVAHVLALSSVLILKSSPRRIVDGLP
jgi:large-conductance mechanosensitive channel